MRPDERREHIQEIAQELLDYAVRQRGHDAGAVQSALLGLGGELVALRAIASGENVAERLSEAAKLVLSHGHMRWAAERGTVVAGHC